MVPPRGFAPRSSAYRADALLLSYGGFRKVGCGGRIRTGGARRMKPLPYHLATPLLVEKLANGALALAGIWKELAG